MKNKNFHNLRKQPRPQFHKKQNLKPLPRKKKDLKIPETETTKNIPIISLESIFNEKNLTAQLELINKKPSEAKMGEGSEPIMIKYADKLWLREFKKLHRLNSFHQAVSKLISIHQAWNKRIGGKT